MVASREGEIDLAQSLLVSPRPYDDCASGAGLIAESGWKLTAPCGASDGVKRPRCFQARFDAGGVGDVDAKTSPVFDPADTMSCRAKARLRLRARARRWRR